MKSIHGVAAPALALALLLSCGGEAAQEPPAAGAQSDAQPEPSAGAGLVPADALFETVDDLPRDPREDPLPDDSVLAAQIVLGYHVMTDPQQYAAEYVGNEMTCANCHPNAGQRERAMPLVGVAATFPQYRGRDARLISLEDRIGDCFERSMNGTRPPADSDVTMGVAAYIAWLSEGQPMGESPPWRGQNRIARDAQLPIDALDVAQGERLFQQHCTLCHGADGQGVDMGGVTPGPLWGPGSWNDGAGAARIYTLAGFIRYAMPMTAPGTLTDEEAQHIAAFINAHERPAFARKTADFPNGDVPIDAVYYPQRYETNPLMRRE